MPLPIVPLGNEFRPPTSIVYPPFKNGKYMEEYFYEFALTHQATIHTEYVYIPVWWTNLLATDIADLQVKLLEACAEYPVDTRFFTIVQADLGTGFVLPPNTLVFGACTGDIPLPLLYEDKNKTLLRTPRLPIKKYVASFVGTYNTHPLRMEMFQTLGRKPKIQCAAKGVWTNQVSQHDATTFVQTTLQSKFCLAPRGFGRSSFRFFEAMLLDTIPVYFWDDVEWLPYKEILDYSKFALSIPKHRIQEAYQMMTSVPSSTYANMVEELKRVRHYFTLEGMCEYIIQKIT